MKADLIRRAWALTAGVAVGVAGCAALQAQERVVRDAGITEIPLGSYVEGDGQSTILGTDGYDETAWSPNDTTFQPCDMLADTGCAVCGDGYGTPDKWYFESGVRLTMRNHAETVTLSLDEVVFADLTDPANPLFNPTGVRTIRRMSTQSLGFDLGAGMDATIKRYLGRDDSNRDHFVELSAWGLTRYDADKTVNALHRVTDTVSVPGSTLEYGSLFAPFVTTTDVLGQTGGFNRADSHWAERISEVNNIELNGRAVPRGRRDRRVLQPNGVWRRECQPGTYFSWLYGVRYITLDERFRMHATGDVVVDGVHNATMGDYSIGATNDLLGLTVGADVVWRKCRFEWGVEVKASPCFNFADQSSTIVINAPGDPLASVNGAGSRGRDEVSAAFAGDVALMASYKLRKNFRIEAKYSFLWITGVALAPEQLRYQLDAAPGINVDGTTFETGLTLAAEWRH